MRTAADLLKLERDSAACTIAPTATVFNAGRIVMLAAALIAALPIPAMAIPLFNRQTGQNCVACHAGGQFPELTPYGRLFKMTGYTLGQRTIPVSAMVLASYSKVANTSTATRPIPATRPEATSLASRPMPTGTARSTPS